MANNKLKLLTSAAITLLMFSFPSKNVAQEWIPEQSSDVILEYDTSDFNTQSDNDSDKAVASEQDMSLLLNTVNEHIENSKYPGNSNKLITAKKLLASVKPEELTNSQTSQYYLIKANIAQSEHQFEQTMLLLDNVDSSSVYYPQSLLVAARVYIIQNKLDLAENKCRQLLSQNIAASELCLIEVRVHQGKTDTVESSIERLAKRYDSSDTPLTRFYHQIKGSMHRINHNYSEAQSSFSFELNEAPVSQWYQWTDMAFENQSQNSVYNKLSKLARNTKPNLEDGLLVRLARAEKLTSKKNEFQSLAQKKVELRVLRNDELHAADIAYYYTYVSPNSELAKKWAERNWSHVKEPADKALLEQAQQFEQ